ncbi:MAG: type III pantothenate kinase [Coprobacillus sp.]|nr:type III pantothenate kinase [Coprobacillus sp.]
MNLCVDVGNSTIVLGVFNGDSLLRKEKIRTNVNGTSSEFISSLQAFKFTGITHIILSSVVPSLNYNLKEALSFLYGVDILTIGAGLKTGILIKTDNPLEIGNDLIADLVGAKKEYPLPLLVVDLGTASKILCLEEDSSFRSALITPGLVSGATFLKNSTTLLPEVGLTKPKSFIAKNTNDCINNGLIYGHAEMIKGLVSRYEEELGVKFNVILTGGCANLVKDLLPDSYIYDEDLLLKGLNELINKNVKEL